MTPGPDLALPYLLKVNVCSWFPVIVTLFTTVLKTGGHASLVAACSNTAYLLKGPANNSTNYAISLSLKDVC